ncbi:acyl-CoA Delta12-desaturase-like [Corticium candelabrum]|uniref:acyl-CoA Delta12-desaturase-like n=1 Tax=Corticium candelabrum TaxID=121492 RepID=UPI002E268A06|nr:acyl-CoA Delta12-desaturase-like [Corticium candelabrum]
MSLHDTASAENDTKVKEMDVPVRLAWGNVITVSLLHLAAFYGFYLLLSGRIYFYTFLFFFPPYWLAGLGITAGVHRLWSHRSYSASFGLRLFLMICNCSAMQTHIYEWSRDHRTHHKFSDTNADPYNARRGFFFSHMGWVVCRKHPDVIKKGRTIDMSDLDADPVVVFQKKYYILLAPFFGIILPTFIPLLWNEYFSHAFFITMLRYVSSLHQTWLVNSAAHMYGNKPYDKNINPTENSLVSWLTIGEGFHNYHHCFPKDYRASEYGFTVLSFTTFFIDCCAWLGLASNCKPTPRDMIERRRMRTGHHG